MMIDLNSIILGIFTLLGGCAWFINWRKDKQEARGIRLENQSKEFELAKKFVEDYDRAIVVPLRHRVDKMESKLDELEDAVHSIYDCPYSGDCPVLDRMASPARRAFRQSNRERCSALAGGELRKQPKGNRERV